MSAPAVSNFRGLSALVAMPDDAGHDTLLKVLRNLGMTVVIADGGENRRREPLPEVDLVLFDADATLSAPLLESLNRTPSIAVIGMETPSRLARLTQLRISTHLMKPLRSSGVFSAVFLAMNEWAERERLSRDREAMAARVRDRRAVIRAVIRVMAHHHIDDDEAFILLRRESMRRRLSLEDLAKKILAASSDPDGEDDDIKALFRL